MAKWSTYDPGVCDLGQLDAMVNALDTVRQAADTVHTQVIAQASAVTDDVWSSDAAAPWRSKVRSAGYHASGLRDHIQELRDATSQYRTSVNGLQQAAEMHKEDLRQGEIERNMSYFLPNPPTQEMLDEIERDQQRAEHKVQQAREALENLAELRKEYDTTFIGAINAALPSSWAGQQAALTAAGLDLTNFSSEEAARQAMLDLARALAESDMYDRSEEEIAALEVMYDLYGDDQAFMSSFYRNLGGQSTVELIEAIGDKVGTRNSLDPNRLLALAQDVRAGLSVGSAEWGRGTADAFVASMFRVDIGMNTSLGFLFNDPLHAPLGQNVAISAAEFIDETERASGNPYFDGFNSMMGGNALSFLEYGDDNDEYMRVQDPAGPIMSTLGHYPDAAFDFLTDPATGDDRVAYWFHDREHLEADGYQGVADLWLGAEQAVTAPEGMSQAEFDERSASLTSLILDKVYTNDYMIRENMSDSAGAALAGVYLANLEGFTEYPISQNLEGVVAGTGVEITLPNGEHMWIPSTEDKQVAALLALASGGSSGASLLLDGTTAYQRTLVANAALSGDPALMHEALSRVSSLQGVLDGADLGAAIDAGERTDTRTREMISNIKDVVGLIPIKGASELVVDGGIWLADTLQDKIIDGALDFGLEHGYAPWLHQEEAAYQAMDQSSEARESAVRNSIASMLYGMYGDDSGVPAPPVLDIPASASESSAQSMFAEYQRDAQQWRMDNADVLSEWLADAAGPAASLDGYANRYDDAASEYALDNVARDKVNG